MELRHLRYFQAAAEELSFSRAAKRLHIAQPALSRAIKQLEHSLGAEVLERTRHFVRLTPAGAVLLREIAVLLEHLEELTRRVRRTAAGEEGELRLGYIGPPTQPFLGRLLRDYRKRYPLVSIHLEERTPERVWEMVAKGRLSAALTRPVLVNEALGLRTVVLQEERLGIVVPTDHRLARRRTVPWTTLAREPLIVLARREGMGLHDAVIAGCRQSGVTPRLAHTPSLIGTVMSYVEAGAGLGVVTESVVTPTPALKFVLLKPVQRVPLVLVWQEDDDSPPVQRFRELLVEWKQAGKLWHGHSGRGRRMNIGA
ncbi:MAG: LysR family transcriptional regulator [Verrucomicrobia bacterium]|nr:MAG: LysR family transcriptional regulator [Verrucomicrobiota bacterium]